MTFIDDELNSLIKYMDPSCDGDMTLSEVKGAFRQALEGETESERVQNGVDVTLRRVDDLMKKKGIRLQQWLQWIDVNEVGVFTTDELREGIAVIIDPERTALPPRTDRDRARRIARLRAFEERTPQARVVLVDTGKPLRPPDEEGQLPATPPRFAGRCPVLGTGECQAAQPHAPFPSSSSATHNREAITEEPRTESGDFTYLSATDNELDSIAEAFILYHDHLLAEDRDVPRRDGVCFYRFLVQETKGRAEDITGKNFVADKAVAVRCYNILRNLRKAWERRKSSEVCL